MPKAKPLIPSGSSLQKPITRLAKPIVLNSQKREVNFADTRFRLLVEHMNEAVWVGDRNENTVYANPKFCEIMEWPLEAMLGRPSYDFWTPESAERVKQVNTQHRKRGISSSYEGELLTRTGKRIPVLLSGTPLPDGGTIGIMTDLREIKKKEKQVETLLSRFDLAVRGSNDGLWYTEIPVRSIHRVPIFDTFLDHGLWYSPRFKEILGFEDSQFPDKLGSWMRLIHPEDQGQVKDLIHSILRTRSSFEIEYRIQNRSGEYRWVNTRGEARADKTGANLFVAGSFRDVTESRRTRVSLAKRVRETHLLYQANAHMRMVHPLRRVFSDLAKDLEHACHTTPGATTYVEFDGRVFSRAHEGQIAKSKFKEPIIVRGKKRGVIELRYAREISPEDSVFNDDRQALMTLGTFIRKHASSREIMERYQKLVKKSVMGVFISQGGVFKFVNPKLARLFRYREAELIGQKIQVLIPKADDLVKASDKPGLRSFRYSVKGRKKDGTFMDLEIITQPIEYHGNEAVLGTVQDVTRLKMASEKIRHFNQELRQKVSERTEDLKKANRRLQSLNELKDEFIAVTSHELRSPLTSIRGYISFIVQDPKSLEAIPVHLKDYLIRVYDNVEVLNNLVTNILDVSRIETGRLELYRKPTDILSLMQDVIRNFSFQLDEKQLTATFTNRLSTPSLVLNLDPIRMRQVFRNILDNAVKYSPPGKRIHFEIETKGIGIQISITDEGIGIPKGQIFEVFDKFKQAKNSQSSYKGGAGLGLFIVKKIVELHNGMIWAESQINKGTTFRLQLPLN